MLSYFTSLALQVKNRFSWYNSFMFQTLLILLLLCIPTILLILLYRKISQLKQSENDKTLFEWLKSMQQSMDITSSSMVKTLQENSRQLNERLEKAAEAMSNVGKEVGQMNEIGRNMRELQEFLKSPKLRGNIGEQVLKDLISQIFPKNSFYLQYQFKSGERVDAAIKTDAGILCIDSKFPMENFQKLSKSKNELEKTQYQKEFVRDIKVHIDSIAKKYILPIEGTMDFALMYVPSESVYYEIINISEIMEFAKQKRIYIVSPSTLYAHLQVILLSFEGKKIEQQSKEVFILLRALQIDYSKVNDSLDIMGKHLRNANEQFTNVKANHASLGSKLSSIHHLESTIEKKAIDEKK